jgi:hypothetical protein
VVVAGEAAPGTGGAGLRGCDPAAPADGLEADGFVTTGGGVGGATGAWLTVGGVVAGAFTAWGRMSNQARIASTPTATAA